MEMEHIRRFVVVVLQVKGSEQIRVAQNNTGMNIWAERQSGSPGMDARSVRVCISSRALPAMSQKWKRRRRSMSVTLSAADPECRVGLQLINYAPAPCAFSNTWYVSPRLLNLTHSLARIKKLFNLS